MNSRLYFTVCLFIALFNFKGNILAQDTYTNPEPDIVITNIFNTTVYYNLDINNDLIDDVKFKIYQYYGDITFSIQSQNNAAFVYLGGYADTLNVNDTIGPTSDWSTANLVLTNTNGGPWSNVKNKFIGVRIVSNTDTLYGWIRMSVVNNYGVRVTIKDYAFNPIPGQPIIAGACILPIAENVSVSDVNNNKNSSDLKVNFDRVVDESKVSEYRIIIVKETQTSNFNLDSVQLIPPGNYFPVIPDGNDFSDTLPPDIRDNEGDLIQEFVPYNVFVLSIADGVIATQNELSAPSDTITLRSPTVAATNVLVTDTFNGNNNYTISVSFNHIPDEITISEYRMFVVETSEADSFNTDSAILIPPGGYYSITPTGNNILINFSSDTLHDYSSNIIAHQISYKVFILSVADGVIANVNALSAPSNSFILSSAANAVRNVLAEDISDSGNANDLKIKFNRVADESTIAGYKIIGVKLADCDSFNLSAANSVSSGNYIFLNCNGSDIDFLLPYFALDNDGNTITNNTPYRFFILSVSDNIHTDINALSSASNIISLSIPDYFKAGQDSGTGVHYHDISPDTVLGEDYHGSNEDYVFDLNNDGFPDFKFHAQSSYSPSHSTGSCSIQTLSNSSISVIQPESLNPDTLRNGNMVNKDLYWRNNTFTLASSTYLSVPPFTNSSSGIWWNKYDKFIGLRVLAYGDTIYGWVRLNVTPPMVVVKDYAWSVYSTNTGIPEIKPFINIYPNPADDVFTVQANSDATLYLFNCTGQEIFSKILQQGSNKVDIKGILSGLYIVKILSRNFTVTEKIIIEH